MMVTAKWYWDETGMKKWRVKVAAILTGDTPFFLISIVKLFKLLVKIIYYHH